MGEVTAVPLMVLIMALWAFLKNAPKRGTVKDHRVFNALVVGLGAGLWGIWYYRITHWLTKLGNEKYKYLFGLGGGATLMLLYLLIFFLVRNFWIFKEPNSQYRPSGRWR
jgi:hypothetical protein